LHAVKPAPVPLLMTVADCALDGGELAGQIERYQQLAGAVTDVQQRGLSLSVRFDCTLDAQLLRETLTVERGCCSFLTIDYEPADLTLWISTDPAHGDVIAALAQALTGPAAAG
jgi:hypothetical protein